MILGRYGAPVFCGEGAAKERLLWRRIPFFPRIRSAESAGGGKASAFPRFICSRVLSESAANLLRAIVLYAR